MLVNFAKKLCVFSLKTKKQVFKIVILYVYCSSICPKS